MWFEHAAAGLTAALHGAIAPTALRYHKFVLCATTGVGLIAVFPHLYSQVATRCRPKRHLDLAALVRRNNDDRSRLSWVELRHRRTRDEVALQWQRNSGDALSVNGAAPVRRACQLLYLHYF